VALAAATSVPLMHLGVEMVMRTNIFSAEAGGSELIMLKLLASPAA
jgi:hypothetical protein